MGVDSPSTMVWIVISQKCPFGQINSVVISILPVLGPESTETPPAGIPWPYGQREEVALILASNIPNAIHFNLAAPEKSLERENLFHVVPFWLNPTSDLNMG